MKDSNAPATKADIQEILKRFDQRFGGLDQRMGGLDDRIDGLDESLNRKLDEFRSDVNRKLDEFRGEMNQKLGEIDRQLRVLVEQTHFNLAEASHDAEAVLNDRRQHLEKRIVRLEQHLGITAA